MVRLNLLLLAVLAACALALVTSQHQARKLYVELQKEQELAKQLDVEWGQLQLEASTWATHARVEKLATRALGMRVPPASTAIRSSSLPEAPSTHESWPYGSSLGSSTTAPAPSPNSTQVLRSFQLI